MLKNNYGRRRRSPRLGASGGQGRWGLFFCFRAVLTNRKLIEGNFHRNSVHSYSVSAGPSFKMGYRKKIMLLATCSLIMYILVEWVAEKKLFLKIVMFCTLVCPTCFCNFEWPQPHSTDNNYPGKQIDLIAAEFWCFTRRKSLPNIFEPDSLWTQFLDRLFLSPHGIPRLDWTCESVSLPLLLFL